MIARRANVSVGLLSHLLAGRKDAVSAETAERLARSLGIATQVLFVPSASTETGRIAS